MKWYLGREKMQYVIRGWPGNKRMPLGRYAAFRYDKEKLEAFLLRLNAPLLLKEKVAYQHAFINDALLDDYLTYLVGHIPKEEGARLEHSYLKRYCLNFFIGKLGLMDPADWFIVSDTKWAAFLLSKQAPKSKKTKRDIINAANRFVRWLRKERPQEVPDKQFDPITRNKLDEVESKRVAAGDVRIRRLLSPQEVTLLCKRAPESIRPAVLLLAHYGLRRNEALGVKSGDVRRDYLWIERQLKTKGVHCAPKGKKSRKVPHWCATAAEAYKWVAAVKAMHPRTFAEAWSLFVEGLVKAGAIEWAYTPHDLRHTWITRMVRKHPLLDVSMAAGHKDQRVTQGYLKDDRSLADEEWQPTGQ